MKQVLIKTFWFILRHFENGQQDYAYKPMNRIILLVVGILFCALAITSLLFSFGAEGYGFLIPVIVFFVVGLVCLIVASLGSDQAVAKIWGNR
ncbi:MAG: hypothetical protein QNJ69_06020 [Gammaproteobacteria bacterium]|nr:hypothetical protein [Gammaproteobacteria bacterium]